MKTYFRIDFFHNVMDVFIGVNEPPFKLESRKETDILTWTYSKIQTNQERWNKI